MYEHKFDVCILDALGDIINSRQGEGWELAAVTHDDKLYELFFKRLAPSKNDRVELANTVLDVLHIVQNLQKDTECQP